MDEIDRISSLPDCLIHHILSFLETKESVCTSILSKRWINVWKSIPVLNLNASEFNQLENFENFVNFVLYNKLFPIPEKLDTFNLAWHPWDEHSHQTINIWMYNLVPLKPREVNIDISNMNDLSFLSHLFNCSALESMFLWLKPSGVFSLIDPTVINYLPSLMSLNLGWLTLEDEFIQKLISGCPVLEELVLENCFLDISEKITSSTMKTLIMSNTGLTEKSRLRIFMPNLVYLSCEVRLGRASFENLLVLEYASVSIWSNGDNSDGNETNLLRGLSNAKTLRLFGYFVKTMLEKEALDVPVFEKLESLVLGAFTINTDLEPIDSLLECAPNLETLTLQQIKMAKTRALEPNGGVREKIRCDGLKTIEILNPSGHEIGVHDLVQFLAVHLKTVKKFIVNEDDDASSWSRSA